MEAPSDKEGLHSFFVALEELRSYGVNPPEASLNVIAFDGEEIPGVASRLDVNRLSGSSESMGSSYGHSTPNASYGNCTLPGAPPLHANPNILHHPPGASTSLSNQRSTARSGRQRKQPRRTRKLDEYFEKHEILDRDITREQYKCLKCNFMVTQKKPRERMFHVILCPMIPVATRWFYYKQYSDAGMPPFYEYPPYGLTARTARKLFTESHTKMLSRLNCLRTKYDPTREPRLGHYFLAKEKVKKSTPIGKCSAEESQVACSLLMQFIVEENVPFAVCDNQERHPRALGRLLSYLRPGFKMPLGYRVRGPLLDEYYCTLANDVRGRLQSLMRECRGTVMLDGSEDINGAPMVNILLRVMGSARISTTTFFLTTIYTGYDTVDADYYVSMTEKVLEKFGGFSNIAAVVTDNTGCVKNARETLERKYPRLVASQDQAHVADRLLGDIGDIEWIAETLTTLASIASVFRRLRKLRARFVELMREYNRSLQRPETTVDSVPTADEPEETTGQPTSEAAEEAATDVAWEKDAYAENAELSCLYLGRSLSSAIEDEEDAETENDATQVPQSFGNGPTSSSQPTRTAVTMKKLSKVRFASNEGLLDEFIRTRPVLVHLVKDELFETLYTAKNHSERLKRENSFRQPVLDEDLLRRATQIHRIFRACRVYLRVFDAETSIASEVFEATRILQDTLERMPLDSFPEPKREHKQELLDIFENRKRGPLPGRKRVKITLLSDLHVAAALLDPYRTPVVSSPHMEAFRRHLTKYLSGVNMSMLGLEESRRTMFFEEVVNQYLVARAIWESDGIMREASDNTTAAEATVLTPLARVVNTRSPIAWWCTGALSKPSDTFQRKAVEELIEFAIRTLSVSPTATATERSFSLENRIHTTQRANLAPEKVRKILFCQWNSRILRNTVRRDEIDVRREAERQVEGMRKLRSVRSSIVSAPSLEPSPMGSANHQTSSDNNVRERSSDYVGGDMREPADGNVLEADASDGNALTVPQRTNGMDDISAAFTGATDMQNNWLEGMFRAALRSTLPCLTQSEEQTGSTIVPQQITSGSNRPQSIRNPSSPFQTLEKDCYPPSSKRQRR